MAILKGSWDAPDQKICIYCVPMIYALTEMDFNIPHAYIPSQLANAHFGGPEGPLMAPLKGSWAVPDQKIFIDFVPMIYGLFGIDFDMQHAYIPSQLVNSHFWGPLWHP